MVCSMTGGTCTTPRSTQTGRCWPRRRCRRSGSVSSWTTAGPADRSCSWTAATAAHSPRAPRAMTRSPWRTGSTAAAARWCSPPPGPPSTPSKARSRSVTGSGRCSQRRLSTGCAAAPRRGNKDGLVTVNDLYRHVYDTVRAAESRQTPGLWASGAEGDIVVARNPLAVRPKGGQRSALVTGAARPRFVNPAPLTAPSYFQDRHLETEQIADFVRTDDHRVIAVVGRGGVGKTAMVCRMLKALESGHLPDKLGELSVDGIVYLSPGAHSVNFPNLVTDLCRLLPAETADRLRQRYQDCLLY